MPAAHNRVDFQGGNAMTTAGWLKRFMAWLIDMHVSMVFLVLAYLGSGWAYDTFDATAALWLSIVFYVIWYAVGFYNRCIYMGLYGHSWGRHLVGMNLVDERTGKPIGILRAFMRENSHFLDWGMLGMGFLLPVWDPKRQTVADKIVHTVTVEGPVPGAPFVLAGAAGGRRPAAA
ncbi:MAG: hypothetical protein GEV11_28390 [Streptosporangiales bacterium]|nr:hypothetical protein [Streptosporangiales bacterium]